VAQAKAKAEAAAKAAGFKLGKLLVTVRVLRVPLNQFLLIEEL